MVRREIVVEIFITAMSIFKENTRHLNVILEVFYREAAASDDSRQTPQELKRAVYKGIANLSFEILRKNFSFNGGKGPNWR